MSGCVLVRYSAHMETEARGPLRPHIVNVRVSDGGRAWILDQISRHPHQRQADVVRAAMTVASQHQHQMDAILKEGKF